VASSQARNLFSSPALSAVILTRQFSNSSPPRHPGTDHQLTPLHHTTVRLKLTRAPSCASTPSSFARYEEPFRVLPPPLSPTPPRCASLKDNFLFPPPESPSPHTTSASQPHEPADKLALITSYLSISLVMMQFRRLLHPQNHQKQTARQTKVVVFASNTSCLLWWSRLQRRTLAVGHTPPITFSSSSSEERNKKPGAEYSWICYFSTGQCDHDIWLIYHFSRQRMAGQRVLCQRRQSPCRPLVRCLPPAAPNNSGRAYPSNNLPFEFKRGAKRNGR
jgi:hypothetical protein